MRKVYQFFFIQLRLFIHMGVSLSLPRDVIVNPSKCFCASKNGGEFPFNYDGAIVFLSLLYMNAVLLVNVVGLVTIE
jgi:hypothetical protein